MRYTIPDKIKQLVPYQPLEGDYQIRLDANESYISLSPMQRQKLQEQFVNLPFHRYPDPYAKQVCQSFAAFYQVNPELVTVGNGSDELIGLIFSAFCGDNDKVGVFAHDFSMYQIDCSIFGVPCEVIPKQPDLTIQMDHAISYINQHQISVVVFSNPCNPTSLGVKREEVIKLLNETQALIVLDEAYMDFWDQSLLDKIEEFDRLIILKTCSKAIGLAGIRVGFAVANPSLTVALKAAKPPYNVNCISQEVAKTILSDKEYLMTAMQQITAHCKWLNRQLEALAKEYPILEVVYPSDTNFIFIKTPLAKDIWEQLLKRSIAIRHMGDYLRISTGNEQENQTLLTALKQILEQYHGEGVR